MEFSVILGVTTKAFTVNMLGNPHERFVYYPFSSDQMTNCSRNNQGIKETHLHWTIFCQIYQKKFNLIETFYETLVSCWRNDRML